MTAPTVAPAPFTSSAPPVSVRSGVGMRTVVSTASMMVLHAAGSGFIPLWIEIAKVALRAAQRAAGASADGDAPEGVAEAVERDDGRERRHVAREDPDRAIGRDRARDAAHRAGDAGRRAVGRVPGGDVLEEAAVTGPAFGRDRHHRRRP